MNVLCDSETMIFLQRIEALTNYHIKLYNLSMDLYDKFFNAILSLELKYEQEYMKSDASIEYNDEIVSIEEVGEMECTDITVDGDSLFFCNDILTKNSYGSAYTFDVLIGIITTPEFDEQNRLLYKQLKNRYANKNHLNKFFLGVNKAKMTLYSQRDTPMSNSKETFEEEQNKEVFISRKRNNFQF